MDNTTNAKIKKIAFRLFLENGYEGTNIREISSKVGIKAASLYFYYKSKEELFFSVYDEICSNNLRHLQNLQVLKQDISLEDKFYLIFKKRVEYYAQDIVTQKFITRFHMFPPEEISLQLRTKFNYWISEENKIIISIIKQCIDNGIIKSSRNINDYLFEYKKFEGFQIYQMLIFNIKMNEKEVEKQWENFWNLLKE
jgi:AcrR family transcriptional regulator